MRMPDAPRAPRVPQGSPDTSSSGSPLGLQGIHSTPRVPGTSPQGSTLRATPSVTHPCDMVPGWLLQATGSVPRTGVDQVVGPQGRLGILAQITLPKQKGWIPLPHPRRGSVSQPLQQRQFKTHSMAMCSCSGSIHHHRLAHLTEEDGTWCSARKCRHLL